MNDNEIEIVVDVDDQASDKFGSIARMARKVADVAGSAVGKLMGAFGSAAGAVGDFATKMVTAAASAGVMAAGTTAATGGMNILAGAVLAAAMAVPALISGFLALAPVLASVGGLAGAAIAGVVGAGVAIGTLGIGLGGVSDAWNAYGKSAGGGGGASKAAGEQAYQAARRIEQAEEALTRAKRSARQASEDVSKAREDERERIEDLTLALISQKYAQEDAADSVTRAKEKLAREKEYGNGNSQSAAQRELERAQHAYNVETERLKDLEKDKKEADRSGVEGSERVKDALDRERQAAEAVKDAQEALADAKRKTEVASGGAAGGVNQFSEAMSKLSPNAQKFVRTLIDLKEKFDGVRRAVQDRLFAGLDETLRNLAEKWGPALLPILGGMADSLNRAAKSIAEGLGDPEFIDNVGVMSEAFGKFTESLGKSAAKIMDAFARIGAAASPILVKIGEYIERISTKFAEWIEKAEKSGELQSFMERAAYYLGLIKDIGGLALGIMGEFLKILFPGSDEAGGGVLEGIKAKLEDIKEWLGEPENQQKIKDMIKKFGDFFDKLVTEWIPDLIKFGEKFGEIAGPIGKVITKLGEVHNFITNKIPNSIDKMAKKGGNIFNGVKEGFRNAVNWIIGKWNNLSFSVPTISTPFGDIGGYNFGTSDINYLATGGITGSGRAVINERGPEAVRLPNGSMVYSAGDSARMMGGQGGGPTDIRIRVDRSTERGMVDVLLSMLRFEIATQYGGDVQLALGENR